jgi:hypothetical protein
MLRSLSYIRSPSPTAVILGDNSAQNAGLAGQEGIIPGSELSCFGSKAVTSGSKAPTAEPEFTRVLGVCLLLPLFSLLPLSLLFTSQYRRMRPAIGNIRLRESRKGVLK